MQNLEPRKNKKNRSRFGVWAAKKFLIFDRLAIVWAGKDG